jgi:2-dehydro-3-deoxyphosphogluconate aldolase / (4S)-4-hydroxy-2-oxoglutarate aldolase
MTHTTPTTAAAGTLHRVLAQQAVVVVVRAPRIPDVSALCDALHRGGIGVVELTFTTPGIEQDLEVAARYAASTEPGAVVVGAGTVTRPDQARAAIDAGASFLVTPGVGPTTPEVARLATDAGVPLMLGAFTPSEVMTAVDLGAEVVKVFPASLGGPKLIADLRGPFPDVPLVPSGGVTAANARQFLEAGALAVSAGTGVVPPAAVAAGDWGLIEEAARSFRADLRPESTTQTP